MQPHEKVKQYLDTICEQIRYKRIHNELREEPENHITDQKQAYIAQGMDEETGTFKAVEQMGDPVMVGTQLDRTHKPKPEWSMIVLTLLLLLTGTFIRLYTAPRETNGLELFYRQLLFTVVGIGLMTLCYKVDFTILGEYSSILFFALAAIIVLLMLVINPVDGRFIYASYPLLLFPALFAGVVYSMSNRGYSGVILCGIYFTIPLILSLLIPNITITLFLTLSYLVILTIAIQKKRFKVNQHHALLLVYVPFIISFVVAMTNNNLIYRLKIVFTPSLAPMGVGYMGNITRGIMKGARLIGQGALPENLQGLTVEQVLPLINSDFLLTYITHRFGWIAFLIVVALLELFIIRAFVLCARQKSVLALLVSTAVTLTFAYQTLGFVVTNCGFYLFAPLSLPLISQSSHYLLVNMSLIGILLSVYRTGHMVHDKRFPEKPDRRPFLTIEDGRIIIDLHLD
ncbi:MAG TPA: FtsW/RodA/SpoVE family cell cycle protein [Clostridiales bacterium]|nr:FtsW/RodA/SpoVE family cell cycle protein [Clostridiales bacterium]